MTQLSIPSASAWSIVFWILVILAGICFLASVIACIRSCCPCRCCYNEEDVLTEGGCCICCVSSNNYSNETASAVGQGRRHFVYTEIFPDEPSTASISSNTSDTVHQTSRPRTISMKKNKMLADCKSFKYKRGTKWIFGRSRKCRNDVCPICIEEYSNGDDLVLCPCRHAYHRLCLESWLRVKNLCPLCKKPVCKRSERTPLLYDFWGRWSQKMLCRWIALTCWADLDI